MKLHELVNSVQVLRDLSAKELKGSLSFKIFRICEAVDEHLKTYEEVRLKLLAQHGELSEDKTSFIFEDDKKADAFNKAFAELLNTDVELPVALLTTKEIESIPAITVNDIRSLKWAIK